MLTDLELRALKPTGRIYKVADQRGLYVAVTSSGAVSLPKLQIFPTDLDQQAVEVARTGSYPESILTDIPPRACGVFLRSSVVATSSTKRCATACRSRHTKCRAIRRSRILISCRAATCSGHSLRRDHGDLGGQCPGPINAFFSCRQAGEASSRRAGGGHGERAGATHDRAAGGT